VAGKKRVPRPATGKTAFLTLRIFIEVSRLGRTVSCGRHFHAEIDE